MFYSPLYVGVVGLILAVAAVWAVPKRHTIFWAVVATFSLLITFGGNTFLYSPLYLIAPGFSIFRGQERWAMAFAFSLSVLAGYGFQAASSGRRRAGGGSAGTQEQQGEENSQFAIRNSQFAIRFTKYLFFFAILLTVAFFYGSTTPAGAPTARFTACWRASSLLAVLTLLAWLLWTFAPYLPPNLFAVLAVTLICLDLFSVNWQTNLYPQPPEWHTQNAHRRAGH